MTQSTRTSAQQHSGTSLADSRSKTDPNKAEQESDFENELPGLESQTGEALQKLSASPQQNQLSAAAWSAIISITVKSTPEHELEARRALQELQENLTRAAEEKRKKSKDADVNKEGILSGASTLFGEKTTKAIQSTIDRIAIEQAGLPLKDPASLKKMAEQLVALLAKSEGLIRSSVSAQALEQHLKAILSVDRSPVNDQDLKRVVGASAAQMSVAPVVIGKDLVATTRANPEGVALYLIGKDGPSLLQNRLTALKTVEERIQLLSGLKQALGAAKFSEVVQSYDKRVGVPLAYDLVRASQTSPAEQRALVASCFGSSATLFTKTERERFITFAKSEQALTIEAVKRENTRVVANIGNLERQQVESVRHLADVLKVQNLTSVAPEQLRAEVVNHISQRFPGLKGKSWEDTHVALKDLLSTKDPEEFQKKLAKLGVAPVTPPTSPEAKEQREQLKELLIVMTDHMTKISEIDEQLAKLRTIAATGQHGEEEKLVASFDAITKDIFPDYTPERFATARTEARVYLESLENRIARGQGSELAALCAERDGIEWRALQTRLQVHLKDSTPQLQRAVELINQFQLTCGTGLRGRGAGYARAAETLAGSLSAVGEYVGTAARSAAGALEKCHVEQQALQEKNEKLKADADLLEAKQHNDFSFVSRWFGTDAYTKAVDAATRARKDQQACEAELYAAEKRGDAIKSLIEKVTTDAQKNILMNLVSDGTLTDPRVTPEGLIAALGAIGAVPSDVEGLHASFKALNTKRTDALSKLLDLKLGSKSHFMVNSVERGVAAPLSAEVQVATGAKTGIELVTRIHAAITTDVTLQPSSQAIDALRTVVGRDSELGKQLSALAKSPSNQVLLEKLFARLPVEEVMRIKLFLLSYDRPEIMQLVPTGNGSKRPTIATAQELWTHLVTLKAGGQQPESTVALSVLPGIRSQQEVEALLKNVATDRLPEVLAEYARLTGASLGQTLISLAPPAGPIRSLYIASVLCTSPFVGERDLAPFFPNGQVPTSIEDRTRAMQTILARDHRSLPDVAPEVTKAIKEQAEERAVLLAALPVMTQLGRSDRTNEIQKRLALLDESFEKIVSQSLRQYSPDMVARLGERSRIEALRESVTASTQMEIVNPYGKLSRDASSLVQIFELPSARSEQGSAAERQKRATAVLDRIRQGNYSESETLLLEVFYAQHVSQRAGSTELSGNIRKDLALFGATGAFNSRQISTLLQGGAALDAYDVELLTEGLRTRNGQMTVRAMIGLEAKHALKDTWQVIVEHNAELKQGWKDIKESKAGRIAGEYYDAVATNDTVKASVISVGSGLEWGVHTGADVLSAAGHFVAVGAGYGIDKTRGLYQDLFGKDITEHAESAYHGAGSLVSGVLHSDPVKVGGAYVQGGLDKIGVGEIDLRCVRKGLDQVSTPEERRQLLSDLNEWAKGFPNSFTYVDGNGPAILQYIRAAGGPLASADAAVIEQLLKVPQERQLTEKQLNEYIMKREQLQFQLAQAETLRANRDYLLKGSEGILTNVNQVYLEAVKDKDTRMSWGPTIDQARKVVDVHGKMVASQSDLLAQHQAGLDDINASAEILRVRAVVLLKSTLQGVDLGLEVDQGTRELGALRKREVAREQVIVRRNDLREWERTAEIEKNALAERDKWVSIGYTVVKTAVIVAVSILATPGAGFLVATAWNVAEKAYKVAFCNMSIGEAFREGLIDLAIDATLLGLSSLRFARVTVSGATPEVKAVTKLKMVFCSPFGKVKLPTGGTSGVIFHEELKAQTRSSLEKKVFQVAEKYFTQPGALKEAPLFLAPLSNGAKVSMRGLFSVGDAARLMIPATSAATSPKGDQLKPIVEKPHGDFGGGSGGKATLVSPDLDLQVAGRAPRLEGVAQAVEVPEPPATPTGSELQATTSGAVPTNTPQIDLDRLLSVTLFNLDAALAYMFGWMGAGAEPPANPPVIPPAPPQNPPVEPPPADRPPGGPGTKPGLTNGPVVEEESPNGNAYTRATSNGASADVAPIPPVDHKQAGVELQQHKTPTAEGLQYYRRQAVHQQVAVPQAVEVAHEHLLALAERDALAAKNRNAQAEMNSQAAQNGNAHAASNLQAHDQAQGTAAHLQNQNSHATAQSAGHAHSELNQQSQSAAWNASAAQTGHAAVEAEIIAPRKKPLSKSIADVKSGKVEVIEASFNLVDGKLVAKGVVGADANVASNASKKNAEGVVEQKAAAQAEVVSASKKAAESSRKEAEETQQRVVQRAEAERVRSAALREEAIASSDAVAVQSLNHMAQRGQSAMNSQLTQSALAEAQEREAVSASAVYGAVDTMTATPPRMKSSTVLDGAIIGDSDGESDSASSEDEKQSADRASVASKKRARTSPQGAARERAVIIQQLLTRSFEQGKREKLLRMLLALGISEKEYRELVIRVGQAEAERMASAHQPRQAIAIESRDILPKSDVPTMKSSAPRSGSSLSGKDTLRTRADLLAKLRNQA